MQKANQKTFKKRKIFSIIWDKNLPFSCLCNNVSCNLKTYQTRKNIPSSLNIFTVARLACYRPKSTCRSLIFILVNTHTDIHGQHNRPTTCMFIVSYYKHFYLTLVFIFNLLLNVEWSLSVFNFFFISYVWLETMDAFWFLIYSYSWNTRKIFALSWSFFCGWVVCHVNYFINTCKAIRFMSACFR